MEKVEVITYRWTVTFPDGSITYFQHYSTMLEELVKAVRRCHPDDVFKIRRLRD